MTEKIFLFAGLKCQDTSVRISNSIGPNSSFAECPNARCENMAPDIEKKKPA